MWICINGSREGVGGLSTRMGEDGCGLSDNASSEIIPPPPPPSSSKWSKKKHCTKLHAGSKTSWQFEGKKVQKYEGENLPVSLF